MEEAVGYVKGNKKGFRTTEIKIMEPKNITALQIKALRKKLNMSQNVFACFLNVHDKTVKGWEQGLNVPKGLALRVVISQARFDTGGSTKVVTAEQIIEKIKGALPSAEVKANDMTGGGDHWQVAIRAEEFSGKSMVEQHQMVYAALGDWMKKDIHALALDTDTP